MPAAIRIHELRKAYRGVLALDGVTLDIPDASVSALLGGNGAGKTTLLAIVAGLVRATAGTAEVAGISAGNARALRRAIGYLGQEPRFRDSLSARQVLASAAAASYPVVTRPIDRLVAATLASTGLADVADRPTHTYSCAMRQRLAIARAVIGRPRILLLDEPGGALDPVSRRDVLELIRSLRGEHTIVYSTRVLDDVERFSDHVAILDRGQLLRAGPTDELKAAIGHDRIRVVIRGAGGAPAGDLAALPGVATVEVAADDGGQATFLVRAQPAATDTVEGAIARYAVAAGLAVISSAHEGSGLRDDLLRMLRSTVL